MNNIGKERTRKEKLCQINDAIISARNVHVYVTDIFLNKVVSD